MTKTRHIAVDRTTYVWDAYWGTWSRLLGLKRTAEGHDIGFVELNLTPIRNCPGSMWRSDVAPFRIREHGTMPSSGDMTTRELPDSVLHEMVRNMGGAHTLLLLEIQPIHLIDWKKYDRVCNGGANLLDILRDGVDTNLPIIERLRAL